MNFDVAGARKAGYSSTEIAEFLGSQRGFDVQGALSSGYSPDELIDYLGAMPQEESFFSLDTVKRVGETALELAAPIGKLLGVTGQRGEDKPEEVGSVFDTVKAEPLDPSRPKRNFGLDQPRRDYASVPGGRLILPSDDGVVGRAADSFASFAERATAGGLRAASDAADLVGASDVAGDLRSTASGVNAVARDRQVGLSMAGEIREADPTMGGVEKFAQKYGPEVLAQIPQVGVALLSGGITLPAVLSGLEAYGDARQKGLNPVDATAYAVGMGGFEAIGEKLGGMGALSNAFESALTKGFTKDAVADLSKRLLTAGVREVPSEEITYVGQYGLGQAFGTEAPATLENFLEGAKDTAIVAAGMGGMMGGVGGAVSLATGDFQRQQRLAADMASADQARTDALAKWQAAFDPKQQAIALERQRLEAMRTNSQRAAADPTPVLTAKTTDEAIAAAENMVKAGSDALAAGDVIQRVDQAALLAAAEADVAAAQADAVIRQTLGMDAPVAEAPAAERAEPSIGEGVLNLRNTVSEILKPGEAQPALTVQPNPSGTVTVLGNIETAQRVLREAGVTQVIPSTGGLMVSKAQAPAAVEAVQKVQAPAEVAQPQARQPAPSTQPLGQNSVPMDQGGKPFKTKDAAAKAKKLQPMLRVVKVAGGYALAEKTPAQLAAQEKAAKRLGGVGSGPLSAHAFIASNGGLSKAVAADLGIDGNVRVGGRWLYAHTGGLTLEQATEKLLEAGYIGADNQNDALDIIRRSVQTPQYTPAGWEQIAQAESQARYEDHLAAQQEAAQDDDFDPFAGGVVGDYTAEIDEVGVRLVDDQVKAEYAALLETLEARGIDAETLIEDAARQTADLTEQEFYERAIQIFKQAIAESTGSRGDAANRGGDQGQSGQAQRGGGTDGRADDGTEGVQGAEQGLTSYTPEEVTQRQEQQDQADRERQQQAREAEQREQQDEERKRIAQASVRAADTFELGQDPLDSLTGQEGLKFSRAKANQRDADYFAAIERGDMDAAQKMVDQAARDAGYISGTDYRMAHSAPNSETDTSLVNLREEGLVPADYWTKPQWYQTTPEEMDAWRKVTDLFRRLDAKSQPGKPYPVAMTVYRSAPKGVKDGSIRNGDWVTPSLEYAKMEGESIPGGYRIITQQVLAKDLYWDGNSIAELGYDDGQGYAYKNTKNNRKLTDAITRDDDGNIIPLSQRFNSRSDDVRRSFAGQSAKTADQFQLSKAKERLDAGDNPERVRQDTGWSLGVDGKWRFEISDDGATLLLNFPDAPSLAEGLSQIQKQDGGAMLRQILDHEKLFAAYPQLGRVWVRFALGESMGGARGSYSPGSNTITLNSGMAPDQALSTLMHELQHAIQEMEGFAVGGYTDGEFRDAVKDALKRMEKGEQAKVERWRLLNSDKIAAADTAAAVARMAVMYESAQRLMDYANSDKPSGKLRLIRNEMQWIYAEEFRDNEVARELQRDFYRIPKPSRMRERNLFLRDMAERGSQLLKDAIPRQQLQAFRDDERTTKSMVAALRREADRKRKALGELQGLERNAKNAAKVREAHDLSTAFEVYRALAGEVEARNTQTRLKMTEDERRRTSPLVTADVPAEQVVVMFGGLDIQAPMLSQDRPAGTPITQIRAALTQAYGNLLPQLENKGLVTLTQTMEQAVDAAAQARAAKTGGDVEAIKRSLMAGVMPSAAQRIWVGSRTVNDAIIPETPEYEGSTTGDLAYVPEGAKVPAGPIRVPAGQAFGAHRGFGVEHIADNARRDARRAPAKETGDLAEDVMRQTVAVLNGVRQIHDDSGAVVLVNPSLKMAIVAQWQGDHYSVVSVRPYQGDPQNLWGFPNRVGRLTFPTRDAAATSPSTTDAEATKLRQGRTGLDVKSEKFNLTSDASKPQAAAPTVTVKKRRTLDIKRSANGDIQGFFDPASGQAFMVADNLTADAAPGVLMHEVGVHMANDGTLDGVYQRADVMIRAGKGNAFFDDVRRRMDDAGETSPEEAAAYLVEAYERNRTGAPKSVSQWFKDFAAAVRAWLFKKGVLIKADDLTAADIAAVARASARELARGDNAPANQQNGEQKGSVSAKPNFYDRLRAGLADGRRDSEDGLLADLGAADKAAAPRWGFIADRRRNDSLATAYWRGDVAAEDGYFTTGIVHRSGGKPAFTMVLFPESALVDGSEADVVKAFKGNKYAWYMTAVEESAGNWQVVTDAVDANGAYFQKLMDAGRLKPVQDGFHQLQLTGDVTEWDLLREGARRLSIFLDGQTPSIRFVRATGAKPGKVAAWTPERVEARFSQAKFTNSAAFKAWFGESKVVDADGKPLVVYHGTKGDFNKFSLEKFGQTDGGWAGEGFYFAPNPDEASLYATSISSPYGNSTGANVMPVFLSAKNPLEWRIGKDADRRIQNKRNELGAKAFAEWVQAQGYDSIHITSPDIGKVKGEDQWVVFKPEQIKSALGNNGTFDPTNPDIRFSRAATPQNNSVAEGRLSGLTTAPRPGVDSPNLMERMAVATKVFGYDKANRIALRPTAALYGLIGNAAEPLLNKLQLKAATPEMAAQLRQMKLQVQEAQERALVIANATQKMTEAEREMVSDIIEKEVAVGVIPPVHAVKLAGTMSMAMSGQSKELVSLGMLSQEAADRWDGTYLPRFYESRLRTKAKDVWADALKRLMGRTNMLRGINGKHLKSRGLFEVIDEADLPAYQQMGWEIRDDQYQAGLVQGGKVQVWRDFSRQERDKMGEIRDAGFRFVMGYMQTQKDIALGRMYEGIAANTDMASRYEREGWVLVPDTKVPETGAKRYGKLSGMYVQPEVFSQLSLADEQSNEVWSLYRKALSIWKEGKTVLNPVSHVNNVVSNLTMAHLAGVSYWDTHKYIGAIKDMATGGGFLMEAKKAGMFLGSMTEAELLQTLPNELQDLARKQDGTLERAVGTAYNLFTFFLRKPMGAAYQAEDTFFRYLIYRDARNQGMAPEDAVDYALRYIFAYDDLPKGARIVRDVAIPFFAYTYKFIPAALHTALNYPWRMATPAAVFYAANAAMYAIAAGEDDDEWMEKLKKYVTDADYRQRVKDFEEMERKNLPPWMKGYTSLGTVRAIRLGTDEVTGLPLFIDTSRVIPGGDIFDVNPNAGGVPVFQWITPSSPLFTTGVAMFANKDLFFGKDLVDKNDTSAEAAEKRLGWLYKQVTPAIAIGNYHWDRTMNAIVQATGKELTYVPDLLGGDASGIGRDGMPVQPKFAAMQTFGIKVRPIDLETSEAIASSQSQKLIRDIDAEIRQLDRLFQKGAILDRVYDEQKAYAEEKKQRLSDGLTVDGDEK